MGKTVKARKHHGADSLDLTIPAKLVREHDLSSGDIFEVSIDDSDGNLKLSYKLVYQSG